MKVLVTGGTGYLGSAIVRSLARRGHTPIVFARGATAADLPGTAIDGDVRDRRSVLRAATGVDAVCHTAALVSLWRRDPGEFDAVNVGGLEAMLDVCRELGVPRIVCTSSFLALPPAGAARALEANDYQRTKVRAREVTRAAAARGAPIVTLFPGVVYGPGPRTEGNLIGRLVTDHLAGRLPGVIGAERIWSYAFVDDVAAGHVSAIERGRSGTEYVLGGENATQARLFDLVSARTGVRPPRRIPYAAATAAAIVEELRARVTGRPPQLTRGAVEIFRHDWALDSSRTISELSYRVTALADGVQTVVQGLLRGV